MRLLIGSRGSKLALWQANWVKAELERHGHAVQIEIIKTTGDRITDVPLAKVGGKGLFTREIEETLRAGRVHLAVHSLKDLPTELPAGLMLGAVPRREDPRDALVCGAAAQGARDLTSLPAGSLVGTSSLRRSAQLLHFRPDLKIEPLRGNLDTRLRKLDDGGMAAIVVACAGLRRMGWEQRITQLLPPEVVCPAAGQGALGIEVRADDAATRDALAPLDDRAARLETTAERALLERLGGGCQVPIGGSARMQPDGRLRMTAVVASPDGRRLFRAAGDGSDPVELASRLAEQLLRDGAARILDEVYGRGGGEAEALHGAGMPFEVVPGVTPGSGVPAHAGIPLFGRRIVVTRAAHQAAAFVRELRDRGAVAIELPTIELRDPESFEPLDRALGRLDQYDWLVFTSANGVERFFRRLDSLGRDARAIGGRVCAIGPATAEELRRHGVRADRTAAEFRAEGLVDALAGEELKGRRVLIPRAAVARNLLPKELEARGARVEVVETYHTVASKIDQERIAQVLGEADIITFTSSSTAQNCPPELRALPAASIGPVTTEAATRAGFRVVVEAREYTTGGLLAALESYFAR